MILDKETRLVSIEKSKELTEKIRPIITEFFNANATVNKVYLPLVHALFLTNLLYDYLYSCHVNLKDFNAIESITAVAQMALSLLDKTFRERDKSLH